jgi:alkanesulfonate monooxygenase SsuD/methylene tetrahydromethanopterin reductase-like flavin-dependent oxidoreductase (luciferase family)
MWEDTDMTRQAAPGDEREGHVVTGPRRGVALTPMETRRDVIVGAARLADELGYEIFSLAEGWGFDSTLVLAEAALGTRRIVVCSGVLSVWGRTPATLAMTAATLHQLSGGRYVLGLGASTRALVEGFHDLPYARPAARLREATAKVRALLAGEPARLEGGRGTRPIRLGQPPVPDLPIWIAAMGDRTVRVAAELGDGWFPLLVTRDRLAARVPELDRLRRAAGQRTGPLVVAAGPLTVVDADPEAARGVAAGYVAWYLVAMGDRYARLVSEQGFGAEVEAVRAANPRPSPTRGVVPVEAEILLAELTAYGTAEKVRERLEAWDQVADIVMVGLPAGVPWPMIEATLRAGAP